MMESSVLAWIVETMMTAARAPSCEVAGSESNIIDPPLPLHYCLLLLVGTPRRHRPFALTIRWSRLMALLVVQMLVCCCCVCQGTYRPSHFGPLLVLESTHAQWRGPRGMAPSTAWDVEKASHYCRRIPFWFGGWRLGV